MAWFTKENKAEVAKNLKELTKKYGLKFSLSGTNSLSCRVVVLSGNVDFTRDEYNNFTGEAAKVYAEIRRAMYIDKWYNNTDISTDYFDQSYYISLQIGDWNRPYQFNGKKIK